MYRRIVGIFTIYIFCWISINAQNLILCDSITSWSGDLLQLSEIRHYDLSNNCQNETWATQYPYFTDIAIGTDGEFYGYGFHGLAGDTLYGFFNPTYPATSGGYALGHYGHFQEDTLIQGLTCDTLLRVYAAGKGITEWNELINTETYLGDLPPNMQCQGDLTFYEGALYMVAVGNKLVEVNLQNPMASNFVFDFSPDILPIHGLTTIKIDCDSSVVYATGRAPDFSYSQIYQVDFENQALIEVCDIDYAIWGSASNSECAPAPCEVTVDLDFDNSSGGFINNFYSDTSCLAPIAVTDSDVSILSEPGIVDSIRVQLVGILDGNQEYLSIPNAPNLQIVGEGTSTISIINSGNANLFDFEVVIKEILYWNDAVMPTYGMRDVVFTAYSGVYEGEPSYSFISLNNSEFTLGYQITYPCEGDSSGGFSLTPLGGIAPYTMEWYTGDTTLAISNLSSGYHPYTITDAVGCYRTEDLFLFQPSPIDVDIEVLSSTVICDSSGFLTAVSTGTGFFGSYSWNNGVESVNNLNIPAGTYSVTLTDAFNCMASDTFQLMADTVFIFQTEQLCNGDFFEFNNIEFSTDTSFCINFTNIEGCDSIHCLDLMFLDTVLVTEVAEICIGETYDFNGISFNQDTTLCIPYSLPTGCDSTICLTLDVLGSITNINDSFCENETYDFGGEILASSGIYFDSLISVNGCDSIIVLDLVEITEPIVNLTPDGHLCTQNNIEISAGQHSSYKWSTGEVTSIINVSIPNTYSVTITDDEGCSATENIVISGNDVEIDSITIINPSCFEETDGQINIEFISGGTPPFIYSIDGMNFQQEPIFSNLPADDFTVWVEDIEGCQASIEITLEQPTKIFVNLGEDLILKLGAEILLNPITNAQSPTIQWLPNDYLFCDTCLQTTATPEEPLQYQIIVTNENGCSAIDFMNISVEDQTGVFLPNAFSPNGDNFNDFFTAYADGSIESILSLQIFNRWGVLVFEITDISPNVPELGWNGQFKGELAQSGVYVFAIEVLRIDNVKEFLNGDVLLVR